MIILASLESWNTSSYDIATKYNTLIHYATIMMKETPGSKPSVSYLQKVSHLHQKRPARSANGSLLCCVLATLEVEETGSCCACVWGCKGTNDRDCC